MRHRLVIGYVLAVFITIWRPVHTITSIRTRSLPAGPPPLNIPVTGGGHHINWEPGLREATYQALRREHHPDHRLRTRLQDTPILGYQDAPTPFGDIAVLARGQLYDTVLGYQFVQDPYQNDCDDCHNNSDSFSGEPSSYPNPNKQLLALWTVKRIRHRDISGHRYEIQYTISPIGPAAPAEFVTRNGQFDYHIPGHVFIIKLGPHGSQWAKHQSPTLETPTGRSKYEFGGSYVKEWHRNPDNQRFLIGVDGNGNKHVIPQPVVTREPIRHYHHHYYVPPDEILEVRPLPATQYIPPKKIYHPDATIPTYLRPDRRKPVRPSPTFVQYSERDPTYDVPSTVPVVITTPTTPRPTSGYVRPTQRKPTRPPVEEKPVGLDDIFGGSPKYPDSINAQLPPPEKGTDVTIPYVASTTVARFTTPKSKDVSEVMSTSGVFVTELKSTTMSRPTVTSPTTRSRPTVTSPTTRSRPTVTSETTKSRPTVTSQTTKSRPTVTSQTTRSRPTLTSQTTKNRPTVTSQITIATSRPTVTTTTTQRVPEIITTKARRPLPMQPTTRPIVKPPIYYTPPAVMNRLKKPTRPPINDSEEDVDVFEPIVTKPTTPKVGITQTSSKSTIKSTTPKFRRPVQPKFPRPAVPTIPESEEDINVFDTVIPTNRGKVTTSKVRPLLPTRRFNIPKGAGKLPPGLPAGTDDSDEDVDVFETVTKENIRKSTLVGDVAKSSEEVINIFETVQPTGNQTEQIRTTISTYIPSIRTTFKTTDSAPTSTRQRSTIYRTTPTQESSDQIFTLRAKEIAITVAMNHRTTPIPTETTEAATEKYVTVPPTDHYVRSTDYDDVKSTPTADSETENTQTYQSTVSGTTHTDNTPITTNCAEKITKTDTTSNFPVTDTTSSALTDKTLPALDKTSSPALTEKTTLPALVQQTSIATLIKQTSKFPMRVESGTIDDNGRLPIENEGAFKKIKIPRNNNRNKNADASDIDIFGEPQRKPTTEQRKNYDEIFSNFNANKDEANKYVRMTPRNNDTRSTRLSKYLRYRKANRLKMNRADLTTVSSADRTETKTSQSLITSISFKVNKSDGVETSTEPIKLQTASDFAAQSLINNANAVTYLSARTRGSRRRYRPTRKPNGQ